MPALAHNQWISGSTPPPATHGSIAQGTEHLASNQGVEGSNPSGASEAITNAKEEIMANKSPDWPVIPGVIVWSIFALVAVAMKLALFGLVIWLLYHLVQYVAGLA